MNYLVVAAGVSLLAVSACQRPFALYQPTPYARPTTTTAAPNHPGSADDEPISATSPAVAPPVSIPPEPVFAAANAGPVESQTARLTTHTNRVTGWTRAGSVPITTAATASVTQPKPRKAAPSHRKSLREMLGLKPRPTLNWWQRIQWQLKASVVVILVAVLFAILGITLLAIVFGLIGAYLLVRGLKKSFKVRRPWF
jgi:uncharacterized membrane protein